MKEIKVLLVYPEFPLTHWSFKSSAEYLGKKASMTPNALATIAALLPPPYKPLKIVDMNVSQLTDSQIKSADLILLSAMNAQETSRNTVIERCHALGKPVGEGGALPSSSPGKTAADFQILGEAEISFPAFLEDFIKGKAKKIYTEAEAIKQKRIKKEDLINNKPKLSLTPIPRWDLVDLKQYASAAIEFSRGCPFNCEFCDITKFYGRIPRTKSNQQMIAEFQSLKDQGYTGAVFIVDANFIGNKAEVRKFLPAAKKWQEKNNYPFNLFTEASMNLAWPENRDILKQMVEAGFNSVFLGIESVDEEVIQQMNKKQNAVMSPYEAVKIIQNAGLEVMGGFIIGNDNDKKTVFQDLDKFIKESGIPIPMVGLLTPIPCTDLHTRLEKEGRLRKDVSQDNTNHLRMGFEPILDEKFLIDGYVSLLKKIFSPKEYYARCRTLQDNMGKSYKGQRKVTKEELMALAKSIKRQLFAKGGTDYAKFILHTILYHPSQFPNSVALAIKYDHLQKITQATSEVHSYPKKAETLYRKFLRKAKAMYKKYSASRNNKKEHNKKIEKVKEKILRKGKKKFMKLHPDFRHDATEAFQTFKKKLIEATNSFKIQPISQTSS